MFLIFWAEKLNEQIRRKRAALSIASVCIGVLSLTSSASAAFLPKWVILLKSLYCLINFQLSIMCLTHFGFHYLQTAMILRSNLYLINSSNLWKSFFSQLSHPLRKQNIWLVIQSPTFNDLSIFHLWYSNNAHNSDGEVEGVWLCFSAYSQKQIVYTSC